MVTAPPDGGIVVVGGTVVWVGGADVGLSIMFMVVVGVAVGIAVGVGVVVAGGVGVVQPAASSRATARRARSTNEYFVFMTSPILLKGNNVSGRHGTRFQAVLPDCWVHARNDVGGF